VTPRSLRVAKRRLKTTVLPIALRGNAVECPVCRRTFRRFHGRDCPACLSPERQRLVWLYLEHTGILDQSLSILHFAPEPPFRRRLERRAHYVAGDIDPREPGVRRIDITSIPFDDGTFDRVLVNHVLEHVPQDRQAMREIYRVLRPGGRLITQHPVAWNRDSTYEDSSITASRDRERHFGQHDHVRIFGRDFEDRLRGVGFDVRAVDFFQELSESAVRRHQLSPRIIHDCRRPASPPGSTL
jgi:SAM-dependent methyltransferase